MGGAQPTKAPTCDWIGASGKSYTYQICDISTDFVEKDGNYIYAKKNDKGLWVPIYIGQGCLSTRCSDQHHKTQCIANKGATHIHAHLNAVEEDRLAEESDLLAHYKNAYKPNGCNEREGG